MVERFQALDKRFSLIQCDDRLGKPGQWHKHQDMLRAHKGYLLSLDADVIIQSEGWRILHRLVQHEILRLSSQDEVEVSQIQQRFIFEVVDVSLFGDPIKACEGDVFRRAMGVLAHVTSCLVEPSSNSSKLTVDDFFIAYAQLKAGKPSIVSREIVAHEHVSGKLTGEFSKKKGGTCGNWQNL